MRDVESNRFQALDELRDWLGEQAKQEPPPFYRLGTTGRLDQFKAAFGPDVDARLEFHTRPESGTVEVRIVGRAGFMRDDHQGVPFESIAGQIDRRTYTPTGQPPASVLRESRSSLAESGIDVIGPGGRILVYHWPRPVAADLVIRKRLDAFGGRWRALAELTDNIPLTAWPAGLFVTCEFGYFELSKYERQDLLRPVFLFSLEIEIDGLSVRRSVAVPATAADDIAPEQGVGDWSTL